MNSDGWAKTARSTLAGFLVLLTTALTAPGDLLQQPTRSLERVIGRGVEPGVGASGCTCGSNGTYLLGTGAQTFGDPVDVATGAFQINESLGGTTGRIPMGIGWQFVSHNAAPGPLVFQRRVFQVLG